MSRKHGVATPIAAVNIAPNRVATPSFWRGAVTGDSVAGDTYTHEAK